MLDPDLRQPRSFDFAAARFVQNKWSAPHGLTTRHFSGSWGKFST